MYGVGKVVLCGFSSHQREQTARVSLKNAYRTCSRSSVFPKGQIVAKKGRTLPSNHCALILAFGPSLYFVSPPNCCPTSKMRGDAGHALRRDFSQKRSSGDGCQRNPSSLSFPNKHLRLHRLRQVLDAVYQDPISTFNTTKSRFYKDLS